MNKQIVDLIKSGEHFQFSNLPMPPSVNTQYFPRIINNKFGKQVSRQIPTAKLEAFKTLVEKDWYMTNLVLANKARSTAQSWLRDGKYIGVLQVCAFPYFDIFTQNGLPQTMDATNRIKALHDCLANVLGIDDKYFYSSGVIKVETKRKTPWCACIFFPVDHVGITDLFPNG